MIYEGNAPGAADIMLETGLNFPSLVAVDLEAGGFDPSLARRDAAATERLRALIADPALRQRFGTDGRNRAVANYSLASQAPRLIDLFREVARR